jgi:hypothetical protein
VAKIINDKGCLPAGEEWLERNLLIVAGVAVGVAFLQVFFYLIITKAWKDILGTSKMPCKVENTSVCILSSCSYGTVHKIYIFM